MDEATPQAVCQALLAALAAADGRRKKRKRNTTPDSIGMAIKRELLERAARDAPAAADFEGWLAQQCEDMADRGLGAVRAMARDVLDEWRMAEAAPSFREWLARGAPSADSEE
jgi:hypothetical protein